MFSHVVIFWTDPAQPNSTAELVAGANKYLKNIPGVIHFHVGQMIFNWHAVPLPPASPTPTPASTNTNAPAAQP